MYLGLTRDVAWLLWEDQREQVTLRFSQREKIVHYFLDDLLTELCDVAAAQKAKRSLPSAPVLTGMSSSAVQERL
jgi:hypothetical protein